MESWNVGVYGTCLSFHHSIVATVRPRCSQPVLLRQSPPLGHSVRRGAARVERAHRYRRGRLADRLRYDRSARPGAPGLVILPIRVRQSGTGAVRAAHPPVRHRSNERRHHPRRADLLERSHGRPRSAIRHTPGPRHHDVHRGRRQRPSAQRQRRRDQGHVRGRRARRGRGGLQCVDRGGVRALQGVAFHARRSRGGLERALHRQSAQRHHVPVAGRAVNDPIRVGVIGAGAISQVAHLPVLRRLPGVEVAAICDNDLSKAQALATRFEVKDTYDDIEEVLRYANVDAVVICTPNHLHEIHVTSALAAGAHVLCERPLALNLAGVERVLQASEKYGKRVMVGMNHRFRSDVQAVRGFLAGGDLGPLQAVRGGWYTFQPSRQLLGWRLRREQAGGGAMLDLGLQLLDLGLWLAGWPAPKRVSAHALRQGKDGVEDMATALVVCENGVSLSIDVSWRHMGEAERFWFDLVGTKGSASVQPLRIFKEIHGNVSDVTPTGASGRETAFAQSYRAEWTYFLAVIKGDVNAPPPRDQLALHRVLEAVYRSADEGRDVLL